MLTVAIALGPIVLLRGFTVDDAWIPARYAAHIGAGLGYRFNATGPITDGVTPLPFAPLIALLSGMSSKIETCWQTARWTGAVAWLLAAGLLGRHAASAGSRWTRFAPLVLLMVSAPLAAWSVAGLESGIVMALMAVAAIATLEREDDTVGVGVAGLAAALRPELLPFAVTLALARFPLRSLSEGAPRFIALLRSLTLASGPWVVVAITRWFTFSSAVPLSAIAKPSDLLHGLAYVIPGITLSGLPALLIAQPGSRAERALVAATIAHLLAVTAAGGDWMPLWRLLTPVFPTMIAVAIHVGERASMPATIARVAVAIALTLVPWNLVGRDASRVVATRDALIQHAREDLDRSRVIATLDIGWVGAASPAHIVDLAGVTDPEVAYLAGGHTSKQIPSTLLPRREVDTIVLLRAPTRAGAPRLDDPIRDDGGPFDRAVEERVANDPWVQESFDISSVLRSGTLSYVVLRKRPAGASKKRSRPAPPSSAAPPVAPFDGYIPDGIND
jgi:hypothetical protein